MKKVKFVKVLISLHTVKVFLEEDEQIPSNPQHQDEESTHTSHQKST